MTNTGTTLPVATDSKSWPVEVIGLGELPRLREGKLTRDGRPTYASGTILMMLRGGEVKADKTASVHVVEPAEAG